jgi:hypothetical protein
VTGGSLGAAGPPPTRDDLVAHLVRTRIAGDVATSRQSNLDNIDKMLAREPDYWFGVELTRDWTPAEVLAVVAKRVGIDPDAQRRSGADRIDPQLCVDALDEAGRLLGDVARARGRVLLATGHPTGVLAVHLRIAEALAAAGCELLTPADGQGVRIGPDLRRIRFLGNVAMVSNGGDLLHTHAPEPMRALLAAGGQRPDLVVADHGWAGVAGEAGIPTIGFADCNDPALFVAAEAGKLAVAVPLDDNVLPVHYGPVAAYLLAGCTRPNGSTGFVPPAP